MSQRKSLQGACLCGKVVIKAASVDSQFGACHCNTCRQWGGGPMLAVDAGTDVVITGEDNLTAYDSSAWAQRGFCKTCGTHLFYRLKQSAKYILPVGLLQGAQDLAFDHQIFIDQKPSHYDFANPTKNMTGAEVFAAHGG